MIPAIDRGPGAARPNGTYGVPTRSPGLLGVLVLVVAILLHPLPAHAQDSAENTAEAVKMLTQWIGLVEELRTHVDRTQLDLEAVLEEYSFEGDALVHFVSTEIAFQQYPGAMRGAEGTLTTRAGNAVDQSVLLARLLKDAGYDARIVRAHLDLDRARELLSELAALKESPGALNVGALPVLERMGQLIAHHMDLASQPVPPAEIDLDRLQALAKGQEVSLKATLEQGGYRFPLREFPPDILEESRDYFWVQYRSGPSDSWRNAHPSFLATPESFLRLQPEQTISGAVPVELQQRLRLTLYASRRTGSRVEEITVAEPWERPLASLFGRSLTFANVHAAALSEQHGDADDRGGVFIPMLNDAAWPGAKGFDLNGNVIPVDAALSHMAGIFTTFSDKSVAAASALAELGTRDDLPRRLMELQDLRIELTVITPDRKERTVSRSFRSTQGARMLTVGSVAQRLVFDFHHGKLSAAQLLDQALEFHAQSLQLAIRQHLEVVNAEIVLEPIRRPPNGARDVDLRVLDRNVPMLVLLDLAAETKREIISYRTEPLIFATRRNQEGSIDEPSGIDIVFNARRSFIVDETGNLRYAPSQSLSWGVWEAVTEAAVVELESANATNVIRASEGMREGKDARLVSESSQLIDFAAREVVQQIQDATDRGYIAVVPPVDDNGGLIRAWWQIDVGTGETIGVTDNGWGGSYFLFANAAEDLALRRKMALVLCVGATLTACRAQSKIMVASIYKIVMTSSKGACELFFLNIPLPPGTPTPCGYLDAGGNVVYEMVRKLEEPIFKQCAETTLKQCLRAALGGA